MPYDLTDQFISKTFGNLLQRTGSENYLYDLKGNQIGDIRISGSIYAQQYVVTSSVTNIVFQQQSGSTIFGDSSDDNHIFSGSLFLAGNGTKPHLSASQGNLTLSGSGPGYIEVAGDISASGDFYSDNNMLVKSSQTGSFLVGADTGSLLENSDTGSFLVNSDTGSMGDLIVTGDISASGNIFLEHAEYLHAKHGPSTLGKLGWVGDRLYIFSGSVGRVTLSGEGFGIGTTAPTKPLQVAGDISASGAIFADNVGVATKEFIPILPSDFTLNDETNGRAMIRTTTSGSHVYSVNTSQHQFALKMIPKGYTATDVIVYGNTSTFFACYSSSISVGTSHQVGTPTAVESSKDITDVIGDGETYVTVEVNTANTAHAINGGKISIQPT